MSQYHHVLAAFDGTGSAEWRNPTGSNSHVFQFYQGFQAPKSDKFYYDGPNTSGSKTATIAQKGLNDLLGVLRNRSRLPGGPHINSEIGGYASLPLEAGGNTRVCIVGHSRGGLAGIWVANELSRWGMPVYFLGLYDAVDRTFGFDPFDPKDGSEWSMGIDSESLSNVHYTYHALRDPAMKSRSSFGNTGRRPLDISQVYQEQVFQTSHGGIGGSPAPEPQYIRTRHYNRGYLHVHTQKVYPFASDMTCVSEQGAARVALCNQQSIAAGQWIIDQAQHLGIPI